MFMFIFERIFIPILISLRTTGRESYTTLPFIVETTIIARAWGYPYLRAKYFLQAVYFLICLLKSITDCV